MLEGTSYTICKDHTPLVTTLSKTSDAWTSGPQRLLSTIAEIWCTIEHLPGKQNVVADALSLESKSQQSKISATHLSNPKTDDAKTSITNLRWKALKIGETSLLFDINTGRPRPFVPKSFKRKIFEMIHTLSRPSIRAIVQLVTEKFVWHSMMKDITRGLENV